MNIPVSTVARINEPWVAEELIANGKTDICMIGRPIYVIVNLRTKLQQARQMIFAHVLDVDVV